MSERHNSPSLQMTWAQAPWDQVVCGFPVLQITSLEVHGDSAGDDMAAFERERDRLGAGLVSCRLPHDRLVESMMLEDRGFRFIEMVYSPELNLSRIQVDTYPAPLTVARATKGDMPMLLDIAGSAFHNERFKMDPRLDPKISDQRYVNWVASSLCHPSQELHVISDGARKIAFFVTELMEDGVCYWHLNAVAPQVQGQGFGRRVWLSMLNQAEQAGARRVRTSVVARNHRVLNLYARLGFSLSAPSMTFHWVRA